MPSYLVQVSYTQSALSAMVQHPENRAEAIRKPIENLGGKAGSFWFSFGDYDVVVITEMPNNVSAAPQVAEPRAAMAPPCSRAEFPREIPSNRVGTPSAKRARAPHRLRVHAPPPPRHRLSSPRPRALCDLRRPWHVAVPERRRLHGGGAALPPADVRLDEMNVCKR